MIGLDTNILVRYMMRDDLSQSRKANELLSSLSVQQQGYITLVTIAELCWVLDRTFRQSRMQIFMAIKDLLDSEELVLEEARLVLDSLMIFGTSNADLADCLIEGRSRAASCTETFTFDRNAAKSAGMTLL